MSLIKKIESGIEDAGKLNTADLGIVLQDMYKLLQKAILFSNLKTLCHIRQAGAKYEQSGTSPIITPGTFYPLPFDTEYILDHDFIVRHSGEDYFTVTTPGLYEITGNWSVSINDPATTLCEEIQLHLYKNGTADAYLDTELMRVPAGVSTWGYLASGHLNGTTLVEFEPGNVFSIRLKHTGSNSLGVSDSHAGFFTIKWIRK